MKLIFLVASLGLNALLGYQVHVHRAKSAASSTRLQEQAARITELDETHAKACQQWSEEEEALKKVLLDKNFEVSSLLNRMNQRESLENSIRELEQSPDLPSTKSVEDITAESFRSLQGILRGTR